MFSRLGDERGSWTLVGLLVAVAAGIVIMFVVLLPHINSGGGTATGARAQKEGLVKPGGPSGQSRTLVGASLDKGKETACMSNLRGIRQMITYYKTSGDPLPATLQDMKLGSAAFCPVNHQLYQYDPNTGAVRCLTPGHEGL
jgi:hypothetical protein